MPQDRKGRVACCNHTEAAFPFLQVDLSATPCSAKLVKWVTVFRLKFTHLPQDRKTPQCQLQARWVTLSSFRFERVALAVQVYVPVPPQTLCPVSAAKAVARTSQGACLDLSLSRKNPFQAGLVRSSKSAASCAVPLLFCKSGLLLLRRSAGLCLTLCDLVLGS